jgi:hypothetical protein
MAAIFSVAAGKRVRRASHAQVNLDTRGKEEKPNGVKRELGAA